MSKIKTVSLYTIRFMWKLKDSDSVNFKIVTDTESGIGEFRKLLLGLDNLESASFEYLHEYDCSRLGVFVPLMEAK